MDFAAIIAVSFLFFMAMLAHYADKHMKNRPVQQQHQR